jgi:hypothetical protein
MIILFPSGNSAYMKYKYKPKFSSDIRIPNTMRILYKTFLLTES